jgi:hypothetical protein
MHPVILVLILAAIAVGAYFVVKSKAVTGISKVPTPTTPPTEGGTGGNVKPD